MNSQFNPNNPDYAIGTAKPGTNTAITGLIANLKPQAPGTDPRYSALQSTNVDLSNDYAKNTPNLVNQSYASAADTAAHGLSQNNAMTKSNFNRRGLLYSGLRKGAESDNATNAASSLASTMAGLNNQAYNTQNTLDTNAMQPGFGIAGLGNNAYTSTSTQEQANIAQQEQQAKLASQAYGALGQGVGSVAGLGASSYLSRPQTPQAPVNYSAGIVGGSGGGGDPYAGYTPQTLNSYFNPYTLASNNSNGYGGA